jgi:hypothetical protein
MTYDDPQGPRLVATTTAPSVELPRGTLGPGGIQAQLSVLARLRDDKRLDAHRLGDTSRRRFIVDGRLGKLPGSLEHIKGDFTAVDGSSYLVAAPPVVVHQVQIGQETLELHMNASREISFIHFECLDTAPKRAFDRFRAAVLPMLDHFSYSTNTPLFLGAVRVNDPTNHLTIFEVTAPYENAVLGTSGHRLFEALRPAYAMYREARNANSDFYRFLCFYKLLEGLLSTFRSRVATEAKVKGIPLTSGRERIPDHAALPTNLRPYVGQSVKKFFDDVLTPGFRTAMAHFETDDGVILHTSDPLHMAQYANLMLIMELSVRTVIARLEVDLGQLNPVMP